MLERQLCDVSGLVALVTGAGGGAQGGLGAQIARVLAQAGAQVAVNDLDAAAAEATAEEIRAQGEPSRRSRPMSLTRSRLTSSSRE